MTHRSRCTSATRSRYGVTRSRWPTCSRGWRNGGPSTTVTSWKITASTRRRRYVVDTDDLGPLPTARSRIFQIDADTVTVENSRFQGTWRCVVKNTETNSTWVTSVTDVKGSTADCRVSATVVFYAKNKCDVVTVIGVSTRWTRITRDPIMKMMFRNNGSPATIVLTSAILISGLCVCTWGCACVLNRWNVYETFDIKSLVQTAMITGGANGWR